MMRSVARERASTQGGRSAQSVQLLGISDLTAARDARAQALGVDAVLPEPALCARLAGQTTNKTDRSAGAPRAGAGAPHQDRGAQELFTGKRHAANGRARFATVLGRSLRAKPDRPLEGCRRSSCSCRPSTVNDFHGSQDRPVGSSPLRLRTFRLSSGQGAGRNAAKMKTLFRLFVGLERYSRSFSRWKILFHVGLASADSPTNGRSLLHLDPESAKESKAVPKPYSIILQDQA